MSNLTELSKDLQKVLEKYGGSLVSASVTYNASSCADVVFEAVLYPQPDQVIDTPPEKQYEIVRREKTE